MSKFIKNNGFYVEQFFEFVIDSIGAIFLFAVAIISLVPPVGILVCFEYYYVNFIKRFCLLTFIRFRDLTQIIYLWITSMYLYAITKSQSAWL